MASDKKSDGHWLLPPFTAWMSAGMLYMFLAGWGIAAARVIPYLLELAEKSPRLAALGWLGLFASPIFIVAIGHHVTHGFMDRFDARKAGSGLFPGVQSLWAGCFAWFALAFSTVASAFVLLAIFPPPPEEGAMTAILHTVTDVRIRASVHTFVWVAIAAYLYSIERFAKKQQAD